MFHGKWYHGRFGPLRYGSCIDTASVTLSNAVTMRPCHSRIKLSCGQQVIGDLQALDVAAEHEASGLGGAGDFADPVDDAEAG